ncbi:excinuclease ABC subunit UvrA, partial [bacterium]
GGLGYMKLGQSATTLSGGEAQRLKICAELGIAKRKNYLYILDEPTVGLHPDDIKKLINVLDNLIDAGNTVLMVEHNLDVIKCADWIIDLGPEGGEGGGYIVAQGTPEEVTKKKKSYTGQFLRDYLKQR